MRRLAEDRFGVSLSEGWQDAGMALLRRFQASGAGLVITVDEIHAGDRDEVAKIGAAIQARASLTKACRRPGLGGAASCSVRASG